MSSPVLNFSLQGNPRVTLSLQKTNLPVFFARMFGRSAATVSATATAEAYNPAYSQNNTGSFVPAAPKCVKPFLVPNLDPRSSQPLVDETKGLVTAAAPSFLGEEIELTSPCTGNGNGKKGCNLPGKYVPTAGDYLPMLVSGTHTYCPSDAPHKDTKTESSPVASNEPMTSALNNETTSSAPSAARIAQSSRDWSPRRRRAAHTTSSGPPSGVPQQDLLDVSNFTTSSGPPKISPGTFSQARYNIAGNAVMDTSDSIITVPLFHVPATMPANSQLTIVGFLQLFVNYVKPPGPGQPDVDAYIVNVIGCGNSAASGAAVSGGGVSPIPVRLVHN